jgi:hypothetical protein
VGQFDLVSDSHLEPTTRFYFSVWQLRVSWRGAPSLTRRWVCNLLVQLLWALPEHSLSGPSTSEPRPYFTVSFETPPTWRARSLYSYPPETGSLVTTRPLCSLFVASCNSQGYGGGILTPPNGSSSNQGIERRQFKTLYMPSEYIYKSFQSCKALLKHPVYLYNAIGIATGYGLDDREVGVRVPVRRRLFMSSYQL